MSPRSNTILFADDNVLYTPIKIMEDEIKFQKDFGQTQRVGEILADGDPPKEVPSLARNQQEEPCQEGLYRCI